MVLFSYTIANFGYLIKNKIFDDDKSKGNIQYFKTVNTCEINICMVCSLAPSFLPHLISSFTSYNA